MNSQNIDQIRQLRASAVALEGFHDTFKEKYSSDSSCDKKGYGFGCDDRFTAFRLQTHFASWKGYYGNSSCSTVLRLPGAAVEPYFIKALNHHQREIFATAARLMKEEAAALVAKAESEIASMRALLDEASSDAAKAQGAEA